MAKEKPQEGGEIAELREEIRRLRVELDEVKGRLQILERQNPTQQEPAQKTGEISKLADGVHEEAGKAVEAVRSNRMPTFKELCERKETAIKLTHGLLAIPAKKSGDYYKKGYFIIPDPDEENYETRRGFDSKFIEKFYSGFIETREHRSWANVFANYNITEVAWTDQDCSTIQDAEKIADGFVKAGKLEPNDRLKSHYWKPPRKSVSELLESIGDERSGCKLSRGCILVPVVDKPPYCMKNDNYSVDNYYYIIPDPKQLVGAYMRGYSRYFEFEKDVDDYTYAHLCEFTQAAAIIVSDEENNQSYIDISQLDILHNVYKGKVRLKQIPVSI